MNFMNPSYFKLKCVKLFCNRLNQNRAKKAQSSVIGSDVSFLKPWEMTKDVSQIDVQGHQGFMAFHRTNETIMFLRGFILLHICHRLQGQR